MTGAYKLTAESIDLKYTLTYVGHDVINCRSDILTSLKWISLLASGYALAECQPDCETK